MTKKDGLSKQDIILGYSKITGRSSEKQQWASESKQKHQAVPRYPTLDMIKNIYVCVSYN